MKIITQCPFCSKPVELESDAIDKRIRCPQCRLLFKIPHKDQLSTAFDKIKDSKSQIYIDKKGNTYA